MPFGRFGWDLDYIVNRIRYCLNLLFIVTAPKHNSRLSATSTSSYVNAPVIWLIAGKQETKQKQAYISV